MQKAIWFTCLVGGLGITREVLVLHNDKQSAIQLAKNPMHHFRSKHFDMKYHFIQDMVEKKVVELHYCNTKDNLVDLFTKDVATRQFVMLRDYLVNPLTFKGEYVRQFC